jgi:uncharacterized membrane protein YvbJ
VKKCPFCAEEIQDEAVKCKHCGSMLDKKDAEKWYFKTSTLVMAFLCVFPLSPLVLPLLWFNPRFSTKSKVIISVVVIVVSFVVGRMFVHSLLSLWKSYDGMLEPVSY